MARYSEGVGMLMGHLGGQIGTVDSSINAAVSAKSGDGTGTITGTITGIANAATMFPGKAPGVVGGSVVLLTNVAKNGGDLSKLTIGDVLSIGAAAATVVASLTPVGAVVALGLTAAGAGYTFFQLQNPGFNPTMGELFDAWKEKSNRDGKYHIYDPLTLDLDGDGIETVSHNGYKGALFDHDGDGIRTASGWVASDDGLLVVDRNGDGIINDGKELFGDSSVLKDGTKAAHGYAALAEYDSNGDGVVDAKDADFDKLRVWRDLNQDGVSQKEELFTLEEVGVQSLNVAYQDTNQNLGNGNRLAQEGSSYRYPALQRCQVCRSRIYPFGQQPGHQSLRYRRCRNRTRLF